MKSIAAMVFPASLPPKGRRFRSFRSVTALMLREMEATYGRSPGGYLWTILEPVAGIALLSLVFSAILRSPALGTSFPYFYATGLLPLGFYTGISTLIAGSIKFSKPLLAYPAVTFMDALLARFLLNALTQFLVMVLVLSGIIIIYDIKPILDWSSIFLAISMLLALTLSVGVMNCYLFTAYPLWERVWAVLNRPMFILSGIFFVPENVPLQYREWFMLNPVASIVSEMRKGFFPTYDGVYADPPYVFMISIVLGIFGMIFLIKNHKDIVLK